MDKMIPIIKMRYLMEQDSESSENEESLPVPSTLVDNLNSSIDSTSPVDIVLAFDSISLVPSTSSGIQENYDDFRFEAARRSSFQNWPVSSIDPARLAAAGLYYTGEMDIVRCFECQLKISEWSEDHTPILIHKMYSPDCKFVRNEHCNNVPIGADPDKYLRIKQRNRNKSCPYGLSYKESFNFNEHRFLRNKRNPTAYDLSRLGLKKVKTPEHLDYASYQTRLNSFTTWPTHMTQTREQLAEAGFYYSGIDDITICYHCGIHIGSWRIEEDVWVQHANLSPGCPYLLTIRGTEYVNNVTGKELYEISEQAPIQATDGNHERSHTENETNEMTLVEKLAALKEENKKLIDARLCKVCSEREATITFLPCGHLVTCQYCSRAFENCIICKKQIKAQSHTYFA